MHTWAHAIDSEEIVFPFLIISAELKYTYEVRVSLWVQQESQAHLKEDQRIPCRDGMLHFEVRMERYYRCIKHRYVLFSSLNSSGVPGSEVTSRVQLSMSFWR